MRYHESRPPVALRPFIRCMWELQHDYQSSSYSDERLWATPHATLLIFLEGSFEVSDGARTTRLPRLVLMGPRTRPIRLTGTGPVHLVAARFEVGGTAHLLRQPPEMYVNAMLAAREALCVPTPEMTRGRTYRAAALDQLTHWLERHLSDGSIDEVVSAGCRVIEQAKGKVTVRAIASKVAVSPRTLERRFLKTVGMPPGKVATMARFNEARVRLTADRNTDLSLLAAASGHADHPHLTRSFRQHLNLSPTQFRRLLEDIDLSLADRDVAIVQATAIEQRVPSDDIAEEDG